MGGMLQLTCDEGHGRYIGPVKLIECARDFGADARVGVELLTFLEQTQMLMPVTRFREPREILVRRLVERAPYYADPTLASEPEGPRLNSYYEMDKRRGRWSHPRVENGRLHPFDDVSVGASDFFEDPLATPADDHTYAPVSIGRQNDGRALLEYSACVPLYRRWQALHFAELVDAAGTIFHSLDSTTTAAVDALLRGRMVASLPRALTYLNSGEPREISSFARHRKALEAVSWYRAYAFRALQMSDSEDMPGGTFRIAGQALDDLRAEEVICARESLARSAATEDDLVSMLRWTSEKIVDLHRSDRARLEKGYRELAIMADEILQALGRSYDEVRNLVGGTPPLLARAFPDWADTQIQHVLQTMEARIIPDLARSIPPPAAIPDLDRARKFCTWISDQGLAQILWHFERLIALSDRRDAIGLAAVAREVSGMAAGFEHVCNGLGAPGRTLGPKVCHLWGAYGFVEAEFAVLIDARLTGASNPAEFKDKLIRLGVWTSPQRMSLSEDLAAAVLIRNFTAHHAYKPEHRHEAIELFIVILRASFATWHITSP